MQAQGRQQAGFGSVAISTTYVLCIYSDRLTRSQPHGNITVSKKEPRVKASTKKNAQLVLRLDKDERDAFVDLCKELDTSAAREIRRFIRGFMKENADP